MKTLNNFSVKKQAQIKGLYQYLVSRYASSGNVEIDTTTGIIAVDDTRPGRKYYRVKRNKIQKRYYDIAWQDSGININLIHNS